MPWYSLLLVLHFLGLGVVFGCFVLYARAGAGLRAAPEAPQVDDWLQLLADARRMLFGGGAMLLLSGAAMAAMRWREPAAFVAIGLATLLVVWIVGARVTHEQLAALHAAPPQSRATVIRRRGAWTTMAALNGAVLGVLIVMTLKPSWIWAAGIVAVAAALGAGAMSRAARLPAPQGGDAA